MSKKKLTAEQVFVLWKTEVEQEVGKARYTSTERLEQLDALCESFVKYQIEFDDALMFKRKFIEFVVTREGMKGNGRYKGWKEKADENFEGILVRWYAGEFQISEPLMKTKKEQKLEHYGVGDYMIRMPMIVEWSKNKFKTSWTEGICLESHKVASTLNNMFVEEVLESNWSKTGEDIPKWAKSSCV